jgi:hypothetical protein
MGIFSKVGILSLTAAVSAFAAPITCQSTQGDYAIEVSSNLQSATIERDGQVIRWGDMTCYDVFTQQVRSEGVPLVDCHSTGIYDAGYSVYLYRPQGAVDPVGTVDSLAGARKIADLNCVEAANRD